MTLDEYMEDKSEVIRVNFRQREDCAKAVLELGKEVWSRLDGQERGLVHHKKFTWPPAVIVFVGSWLHWALSADHALTFNFGSFLTLAGIAWGLGMSAERRTIESEIRAMSQAQRSLLNQWLTAGGSLDDYWTLRHRTVEAIEIQERGLDVDEETHRKAESALYEAWEESRRVIASRALGARIATYEIDASRT